MQELELYGAALSHIIGWSRSHKAMRLRQLLLRTDVQHNKHILKRDGGTVFSSVVEPEPQGAASFWWSCSCNKMRLRLLHPKIVTWSRINMMRLRNTCFYLIVLF
jgi:hypothetical protein